MLAVGGQARTCQLNELRDGRDRPFPRFGNAAELGRCDVVREEAAAALEHQRAQPPDLKPRWHTKRENESIALSTLKDEQASRLILVIAFQYKTVSDAALSQSPYRFLAGQSDQSARGSRTQSSGAVFHQLISLLEVSVMMDTFT